MMKKLSILLFAALMFSSLYAQADKPITQGSVLIGGSASAGLNTYIPNGGNANNDLYINLYPSAGYFITDGLALGLTPLISIRENYTGLGLTPFVKYYFENGLVLKANAGFQISFYPNATTGNRSSGQFTTGGGIGYAHFLNSRVALEIFLNEQLYFYGGGGIYNDLFFSLGLQAFL